MVNLSDQRVNLECPSCGFTNEVRLRQVALEETVICDGCLNEIKLTDDSGSVRRTIRDVQSLIDGLQ
jgi:peptide subunit release factor 1 (eRF1)